MRFSQEKWWWCWEKLVFPKCAKYGQIALELVILGSSWQQTKCCLGRVQSGWSKEGTILRTVRCSAVDCVDLEWARLGCINWIWFGVSCGHTDPTKADVSAVLGLCSANCAQLRFLMTCRCRHTATVSRLNIPHQAAGGKCSEMDGAENNCTEMCLGFNIKEQCGGYEKYHGQVHETRPRRPLRFAHCVALRGCLRRSVRGARMGRSTNSGRAQVRLRPLCRSVPRPGSGHCCGHWYVTWYVEWYEQQFRLGSGRGSAAATGRVAVIRQ
eukprot:gene22519-biopygen20749